MVTTRRACTRARPLLVAAALAVAAATTGCGSDGAGPTTTSAPAVRGLQAVEIAHIETPVALVGRPGTDDLYVAELDGKVRRLVPNDDGTYEVIEEPVIDVHTQDATEEQGLLGLVFTPDGDQLILSYSDPDDDYNSVLARYDMDGDVADESSREVIITVEQQYHHHQGGSVAFGPDGFLYWGLGDGGNPSDRTGDANNTKAQDPNTLLGKIVRIDPFHPQGDLAYGIPDDNPFADGTEGRPEIWALGFRNPWRFSFDRETGDLWVGDVGDEQREEIDFLPAADGGGRGANLGWRFKEGTLPGGQGGPQPEGLIDPVYEYDHVEGQGEPRAVIGGYRYRGSLNPSLDGLYLFSDNTKGGLEALEVADDGTVQHRVIEVAGEDIDTVVLGYGEDQDGEVYLLMQRAVYQLVTK